MAPRGVTKSVNSDSLLKGSLKQYIHTSRTADKNAVEVHCKRTVKKVDNVRLWACDWQVLNADNVAELVRPVLGHQHHLMLCWLQHYTKRNNVSGNVISEQ